MTQLVVAAAAPVEEIPDDISEPEIIGYEAPQIKREKGEYDDSSSESGDDAAHDEHAGHNH